MMSEERGHSSAAAILREAGNCGAQREKGESPLSSLCQEAISEKNL